MDLLEGVFAEDALEETFFAGVAGVLDETETARGAEGFGDAAAETAGAAGGAEVLAGTATVVVFDVEDLIATALALLAGA